MANNIVAIYAGRFHPFHKGHKAVYDSLAGKFGADKVFIATSGKQNDTDSPFSFKEKAAMMMLTGIPGKAISQEVSPYKPENILKKFSPDTAVVFAVGQKDMDESPRFKPGLKKDGSPTYYQALAGKKVADLEGYEKHGYLIVAPTVKFTVLGEPATSASELRARYGKLDDEQRGKFIEDLFGSYNDVIQKVLDTRLGNVVEEEQQINEWVWVLPALATAARVGGPALLKLLSKGASKTAPVATKVAGNTAKAIVKNPGTTLKWAGAGYVFKSVYDVVEMVKDYVGDLLDNEAIETFANIVWKYKLPVAAVIAVLYGGKKLKDYMDSNPEKTTERKLSGGEKRSREANVKKLKKHKGDFEKRYGDDAESVMYAVATKRAKGESVEEHKFEPHWMYKDGKKIFAKTDAKHKELGKKGWSHDNPKTKEVEEDLDNCKHGKYFCSTEKKWKCRQGPKQTREAYPNKPTVPEFGNQIFGGDKGIIVKQIKRLVNVIEELGELKKNGSVDKETMAIILSQLDQIGNFLKDTPVEEAYKKMLESLYNLNKQDPMDSEILIQGLGRMTLQQAIKRVKEYADEISAVASKDPWTHQSKLTHHIDMLGHYNKAVQDAYKDLAKIRKQGGTRSKGIDPDLSEAETFDTVEGIK